jgi:arylsulfatase A-like enzyme
VPADVLREQETRCPLIVALSGDDRGANLIGQRCQRLVQTTDLYSTLLDWFGVPHSTGDESRSLLQELASDSPGRAAIHVGDEERQFGIRTHEWNCLFRATGDLPLPEHLRIGDDAWPEVVQLFAKPEDAWDVTDLSTLQPDVCEDLISLSSAWKAGRT